VLNTNIPLTPDAPALGVVSIILPLDVPVDDPDVIVTVPPDPTAPEPTVIEIDPPAPDAEVPVPNNNDPLLPLLADPVLNANKPLVPDVALPVLNTNIPLTPDAPALGVVSIILPLDETVDDPDVIVTAPPDLVPAEPALNVIAPP